eukprot:1729026-Rhodomonas_salina.3
MLIQVVEGLDGECWDQLRSAIAGTPLLATRTPVLEYLHRTMSGAQRVHRVLPAVGTECACVLVPGVQRQVGGGPGAAQLLLELVK